MQGEHFLEKHASVLRICHSYSCLRYSYLALPVCTDCVGSSSYLKGP